MKRSLSAREQQIVLLVCQGKLNKEIAGELHMTDGTVKEYLARIYRKVSVRGRTELAVLAIQGKLDGLKISTEH